MRKCVDKTVGMLLPRVILDCIKKDTLHCWTKKTASILTISSISTTSNMVNIVGQIVQGADDDNCHGPWSCSLEPIFRLVEVRGLVEVRARTWTAPHPKLEYKEVF